MLDLARDDGPEAEDERAPIEQRRRNRHGPAALQRVDPDSPPARHRLVRCGVRNAGRQAPEEMQAAPLSVHADLAEIAPQRREQTVAVFPVMSDGQFGIVYQSDALPPKPWSPYVEANKGRVADWSWPWACGGCTAPKYRIF